MKIISKIINAELDTINLTWKIVHEGVTYLIPLIAIAHDEKISESIQLKGPDHIKTRTKRLTQWLENHPEIRKKVLDQIMNRISEFTAYILPKPTTNANR